MPEQEPIKVYVKVDDQNRITAVGSSIFITDPTGWVQIGEGYGDHYAHAQSQYFDSLTIGDGVYKYKLEGSGAVERTADEVEADVAAKPIPTPTAQEDADALLVDHEYRLTILELGV
ncbi:hypothetical protein RWV98_17535 [Agathobaculum sp. NTUH-O15-33]|uniref:hypothetical protein n=1 Tax=Agathobaculum sp. NTUH-O15-33 TaxID=3079302 RepID=UPI002958D729|nr:hypothetical protein [Agathobaculum sp. NTUH-O15-33]WNX84354.1 hypothetical protein RWV98_17535 [Agathobaculum sp. NTUH-O15-33]